MSSLSIWPKMVPKEANPFESAHPMRHAQPGQSQPEGVAHATSARSVGHMVPSLSATGVADSGTPWAHSEGWHRVRAASPWVGHMGHSLLGSDYTLGVIVIYCVY